MDTSIQSFYTIKKSLTFAFVFFIILYGISAPLLTVLALGGLIIMAYVGPIIALYGLYVSFYIFKASKDISRTKGILLSILLGAVLFHSLFLIVFVLAAFDIIPMGAV